MNILSLKKIDLPKIPTISSIKHLKNINHGDRQKMIDAATFLIGHFHEYLIRGGFPQAVIVNSITQSQKLLREDIIDKVLKRDMTALFGVRRILELEQMFIFLCMHDGGIQDTQTISKELGIAKQTVQNFVDLFELTHLIYKLPPFGYGKEVLRGKNKIYLSDPAITPAVLIKGKSTLENPLVLSQCVKTAIIGHLWSHCRTNQALFSYWRNQKNKEVDFIVEIEGEVLPFEVKYQSQLVKKNNILGLVDLLNKKSTILCGYVITKSPNDLGLIEDKKNVYIKLPAALFCYWLGESEFKRENILART